MVEEIDSRDLGPALPLDDWPAWCVQFAGFLTVHRLPRTVELLLQCRACDLALAVPPDFAPARSPQTMLNLAEHGLQHAVYGELPWLREGGA